MKPLLVQLNRFLGKAMLETYAGDGVKVKPQRSGFKELEYKESDWYYRDSYTGFFRSWGQEVIWFKGEPFWNQLYGGGMVDKFNNDTKFARQTFGFLKKALSAGEKQESFQPRGPKYFTDHDWGYVCEWKGDITNFKGNEKILLKRETVFTHNFFGGLILTHSVGPIVLD